MGERSVRIRKVEGSTPFESTKCESGEPPTIYFVGAFFVLTMPLPER